MTPLEILAAIGLLSAMLALAYIAFSRGAVGSAILAATLCGLFSGYSLVTILREGIMPVWINHTSNMWGVQVWWDLLFAVGIAAFFIVPRARTQGMAVVPWILLVAATASIGLLAMAARLFWLESRAQTA